MTGITDWFSADGRLSRLQYAIRTIVISLIFGVVSAFCFGAFMGVLFSTLHLTEVERAEWQDSGEADPPSAGINISAAASGWGASADGEGRFRLDTADGEHKDISYKLEHEPGAAVPIALTGFVSAAIMAVIGLISFWIHLVAQIRRFHDIGQTGLLVLINLIPGASFFLWLFLMLIKGQPGPNSYGPDPLGGQTPPDAA
jgi:uncharacterized membrane protein YhaH (DUF805 family)